jgi:hypothetical protein
MACFIDALPGGFQQFIGDVAGIAAATCLSFFPDGFRKSEGICHLLLEYRMQQFDQKRERGFVIVVKDDFAMADIGLNVIH